MTLVSNSTTVGILYDIENAPFEMLNYTLGKARRFQPCRTIVISDWDARPEQKRWEKLLRRPGFTFRQISRTFLGKNSLDSALYDSAKILYEEGVRRYFVITTDSDFVRIAEMLNSREKSYIIGVGTKQASETLRNAYDEFIVYPPEEKPKAVKAGKKAAKAQVKADEQVEAEKTRGKHHKDHKEMQAPSEQGEGKKTKAAKEAAKALNAAKDKNTAKDKKAAKGKQATAAAELETAAKAEKNAKAEKAEKRGKAAKDAKDVKNAKDKKAAKAGKTAPAAEAENAQLAEKAAKSKKAETSQAAEPQPGKAEKKAARKAAREQDPPAMETAGMLTVRLPKTLRQNLEERRQHEEVTMDELITYLLMRGLAK